jgi:hypothetical protein
VNKTIEVTFSEKINAGNNFKNIDFRDGDGKPVKAAVTIKDRSIFIDPEYDLKYDTAYTINIPDNAITDISGGAANKYHVFSFTTKAKDEPLKVTGFTLNKSSVDIGAGTTVRVAFNRAVSFTLTNTKSGSKNKYADIELRDFNGNIIPINVRVDANMLIIETRTGLEHGMKYTLTIPSGRIMDLDGNRMNESYTTSFTIE